MTYPSIKSLILLVVSLLIIGGVFYVVNVGKPESARVYSPQIGIDSTQKNLIENIDALDSDNDGLKDWEEVLWGTDNSNADSNNNGVSDGEEVALGKNPSNQKEVIQNIENTTTNLNETERFGRDVFAKYIELKQTGLINDPDSRAQAINQMLTSSAYTEIPKTYTEKDIIIISGNTASDDTVLRNYGNSIGSVFLQNETKVRNETLIVKDALDADNPNLLSELDPLIASYTKIIAQLKQIPVPQTLSTNHIRLINSVSEILFITESFKTVFSNPLVALQGVGRYPTAFQNFVDAGLTIKRYLSAAKITYGSTEGGTYFGPIQ